MDLRKPQNDFPQVHKLVKHGASSATNPFSHDDLEFIFNHRSERFAESSFRIVKSIP